MKLIINIAIFKLTIILYSLSTSYLTFGVISDKAVLTKFSPANSTIRCRRYARPFYKQYEHLGTYVYDPRLAYIVPPICIRCPSCCPTPCVYPTPIRINNKQNYSSRLTTRKPTSVNIPIKGVVTLNTIIVYFQYSTK